MLEQPFDLVQRDLPLDVPGSHIDVLVVADPLDVQTGDSGLLDLLVDQGLDLLL